VVASVGSKAGRKFWQVSIRETNENEPSMTRRNSFDVAKTRGVLFLLEGSVGSLMTGQTATGV
jgi:hypothetical protein